MLPKSSARVQVSLSAGQQFLSATGHSWLYKSGPDNPAVNYSHHRPITMRILARSLAALLLFWPALALGQMSGRFYLQKHTFAPGEPVFLYFEVTNSGEQAQNIIQADPYSFCAGYQIRLSTDVNANPSSSCAPLGIGGSCLSSHQMVAPSASHVERILLNYEHKISAPGEYEIDATRHLEYAPASLDFFRAHHSSIDVHQHLSFTIDDNAVPADPNMQDWVVRLHSSDEPIRWEAALTLAAIAPKSQEDVLLSFTGNPELRTWAPMALYRLNTPRSIAALAELLRKSEPGTYESMRSADLLAETGDPQWFPSLLEVARKNPHIVSYLDDAASVGGNQILIDLLAMINSPDEVTRQNATQALGSSGTRQAVPFLLNLLRSDDPSSAGEAIFSLRQLTHLSIAGDWWRDPPSQYPKWAQWWNTEGFTARIYKATECGPVAALK